uniref:HTH 3-helical bundle domain-containing protein n=2 Tax=Oryza TaxID=4527 RepID=A0A0D3GDD9_9ORYZ
MEWTAAELGEARSVIARVSNAYNSSAGSSNSTGDTKHCRIMRKLQATFPSRTMVEVIDLYVNLTVETTAQLQDAGATAAAVVHPTFGLANDNLGMPILNNNNGMVFGGAPMKEGAVAMNSGDGEVVNQDIGFCHSAWAQKTQ